MRKMRARLISDQVNDPNGHVDIGMHFVLGYAALGVYNESLYITHR